MNNNFTIPAGYCARLIDESVPFVQYIGCHPIYSTDNNWIIIKVDETTNITSIKYAQGDWDNRFILNYI